MDRLEENRASLLLDLEQKTPVYQNTMSSGDMEAAQWLIAEGLAKFDDEELKRTPAKLRSEHHTLLDLYDKEVILSVFRS